VGEKDVVVGLGLVTDLYELTMASSYLRRAMTESATFSLFARKLPRGRGFLVAAGLEDVLRLLAEYAFDDTDLAWLAAHGFDAPTIEALAALRFTGDVWAIPEGHVVLADEPLIEVTAPLPEAQLVESIVLNQITYQTALATKAARCRIAARGRASLVDFSLRRTHGIEAGMAAARAAAIAGFVGTSNVEAARRFGIPAVGRWLIRKAGVRDRARCVRRVRDRFPGPCDVPRRHLRHADRCPHRVRSRRCPAPGRACRRSARQR
jgi:nicotinate phosphoribosyltransferase